ncbi:hypothetical protein IM793_24600 [Pedobacter sp. MR2016-19]|uniref:hypothetical protein n=1 Tax=Pedobacter sp. MR2016-19 TaxID=2780089 RepID=UPI0018767B50|nr:hypothetical protein [Pedobacter sp. MR2016-19]MBE5322345.1 hypothetical protein [Pedobacter sp. MR2016-19]
MDSNIIKLSLGSLLTLLIISCINKSENNSNAMVIKKKIIDTCKYYAYDAHQIVSNLSCKSCHLSPDLEERDDRGWPTFRGLAAMDSLKLIDYVFTKKHKGSYSKNGAFKTTIMDTLNECEIKSVIRYIKDSGRDIPMSSQ